MLRDIFHQLLDGLRVFWFMFLACRVAALFEDPKQLLGPDARRFERSLWGAANPGEALPVFNAVDKDERFRAVSVGAHAQARYLIVPE